MELSERAWNRVARRRFTVAQVQRTALLLRAGLRGQVRSGFSPVTRGPDMGTSTPNTQAYGPSGPLRTDLHTH